MWERLMGALAMSRRDRDLEYKVLQIIKEHGEEGILQSLLWKKINASSREGSRVSLRLEKAHLIDRKRELHDGKWTYKLIAKKRSVKADSILDQVCTFCSEQERCGVGGAVSPITCDKLTRWLFEKSGVAQH
ncbi:MAG: transcriptional regulator [Candidatus Bathyarchaeia archaeon]